MLMADSPQVSNISDTVYLGLGKVLSTLGSLLKSRNRHACLITLFMNAVEQTLAARGNRLNARAIIEKLKK